MPYKLIIYMVEVIKTEKKAEQMVVGLFIKSLKRKAIHEDTRFYAQIVIQSNLRKKRRKVESNIMYNL